MSKSKTHQTCPYKGLDEQQYWRKSISNAVPNEVDPFSEPSFKISKTDKIATAGSCFAQHVARYLSASGYNYYVAEQAHPLLSKKIAEDFGYGLFSARYGNIYTSRQLLQLFKRAFEEYSPAEKVWHDGERFYDPLRPFAHKGGYLSEQECLIDQKQHLSYVREMFQNLDVFVFTLGLTETWLSKEDGIAFPVAPGCGVGNFDKSKYIFHNLTVSEVIEDMRSFLIKLKLVNPEAKVIVTVSPVPLVATYEQRSVLCSTVYSKSVLRVASEQLQTEFDNVTYFPSYEIITGPHSRGNYYAEDLREIKEEGVNHVMKIFMRHFCSEQTSSEEGNRYDIKPKELGGTQIDQVNAVLCDEEQYDLKDS